MTPIAITGNDPNRLVAWKMNRSGIATIAASTRFEAGPAKATIACPADAVRGACSG